MKSSSLFVAAILLVSVGCRLLTPGTSTPGSVPTGQQPDGTVPPSNGPAATLSPSGSPTSLSCDERAMFAPGLIETAQGILEDLPTASLYQIRYEIDPDLVNIRGHEQVCYTNTEDISLEDVRFRLLPNLLGGEMHVPEVLVDGQPVTPNYSMADSLITVPLISALQPGESLILEMDFTLQVPQTVDENYGVLASAEGVLALAHSYPMIPVYDDEGWNAELPPEYGDLTFADMSFFIVEVTAPRDLQLVGVGYEFGRTETGSSQVVTYAAGPVRDFYLVASPEYQLVTGRQGETTLNFYLPPGLSNVARSGLDYAARAIEDFNTRYGPYPYTELDIVATPTQALGIEYPGMIAITTHILSEDSGGYFESTVVHEVGHQWFYNLVGTDQLDEPWMDESLTQFATMQYFADEYGQRGEQGYRESMELRWQRVENAPIPIGLPVAEYSGQEYSSIVYGRGGLFFDALREEMGEETFDEFLRDYVEKFSWGIARPEDLKSLAEEHCSCNLTPLFEEWVLP